MATRFFFICFIIVLQNYFSMYNKTNP